MAKSKFDVKIKPETRETPLNNQGQIKSEPLTKTDVLNAWKEMPEVMRKIIVKRTTIGIIALVVGIVFLFIREIAEMNISYGLFAIAAFFIITGISACISALAGRYVTVTGTCSNIEHTSIRGRAKYVYFKTRNTDNLIVTYRFPPKDNDKKYNVGDELTVYIPYKAFIEENEGIYEISDYYGVSLTADHS